MCALPICRTAIMRCSAVGEVAHVGHVVTALLEPDAQVAEDVLGVTSVEELRAFGRDCGFALDRLVSEELAGLIDDGATRWNILSVGKNHSWRSPRPPWYDVPDTGRGRSPPGRG